MHHLRALDDRSGAFIVMEALRRAKEKKCRNGVYAVTTVGEETGFSGGAWAGAGISQTWPLRWM